MRPYSDAAMEEIGRDPVRLRQYFWSCAMNMRRMAARDRRTSKVTAICHPVTNYRPAFEEGVDLVRWADTMDRVANTILDNLDALVASTLETDAHSATKSNP